MFLSSSSTCESSVIRTFITFPRIKDKLIKPVSQLLTTEKLMADHMHDESQGDMSCCAQGSCATHDHNDVAIHDHSHGHGLPITIQYCSG
jgi:hypothetical protein